MTTIAPVYAEDERLQVLLAPDGPFAVEEVVVDGIAVRSFVHAPRSIVDIFRMGRAHESLVHIVFEDERWTFGLVRRMSGSVARQLKERFGVTAGDRVVLAMRNFPEFVVGFWSAALLGAIVVPLNAWWTGPELSYAINDAGARVVFADDERLERLASARDAIDADVRLVGVRTGTDPAGPTTPLPYVPFEALTAGEPLDEAQFAALGPDDPVTILYTSGTTGPPKGALGTNRATIANLMNMAFVAARRVSDLGETGRSGGTVGVACRAAAVPHRGHCVHRGRPDVGLQTGNDAKVVGRAGPGPGPRRRHHDPGRCADRRPADPRPPRGRHDGTGRPQLPAGGRQRAS